MSFSRGVQAEAFESKLDLAFFRYHCLFFLFLEKALDILSKTSSVLTRVDIAFNVRYFKHLVAHLPGKPRSGQKVFCINCMFSSCQWSRLGSQEQEKSNTVGSLSGSKSLQGSHQMSGGK
jgi:hypothetical protein